MSCVHYRVDDRLIHGQVMTVWSRYYKLKQILIVDDAVANDPIQQQIISLVTPPEMTVSITSVADAPSLIKQAEAQNLSTLVLVKGPDALWALHQSGISIKEAILGGIQYKAGRKQISKTISVSPEEADLFNKLAAAGIAITLQVVPTDRAQNFQELIANR